MRSPPVVRTAMTTKRWASPLARVGVGEASLPRDDVDTQTDPITVVGIGDMSGDVFGNGMLLQ